MKKITLLLICFLSVLNISAEVYSGSCGDNANYILDTETGVLSITGTGAMTDYSGSIPWFTQRSYIQTVQIADGITSIGSCAFVECSNLTSVIIPNSITKIGDMTFYNCSGLTSITIPNSVIAIGNYAFNGCNGLAAVHITDLEAWCKISFGNINSNPLRYAHHLFMDGNEISDLIIPNSINSIDKIFSGCTGFISVTIPSSVISIVDDAFSGCINLKKVVLNSNNIEPNGSTLGNIFGFQVSEYVFGDNITSIENYAFKGFNGLNSITIGKNMNKIGIGAFLNCSNLKKIIINSNSITSKEYRSDFSLKEIFGDQVTEYIIGESVTAIGKYAFYGCSNISSITIPNSIINIGWNAFSNCKGLTTLTIPNSVTSIGMEAFSNCSGLEKIYVEKGNTEYDSRENCNALIETATNRLLLGCKNSIIPNSVITIGNGAFAYCSDMTSVTIPNSVTEIGYGAFNSCYGLTSITIPNSVTSIGRNAFLSCSNLESVIIGSDVISIENYAFCICSSLTNLYCYAENVPTINDCVFDYTDITKVTLHVPSKSIDTYKTTTPWSGFGSIIALPEPTLRGDVNGDGNVNGTDIQAVINLIVESQYDENADVNKDGNVNGTDIQEVINIIVGGE